MSAVIVILLLWNKLLANKIPATFRYYMWLIVMIGLLIPFRPAIPLPFEPLRISLPFEAMDMLGAEDERLTGETRLFSPSETARISEMAFRPAALKAVQPYASYILFWIWMTGALTILGFHLWSYAKFNSAVNRWGAETEDERILSIMRAARGAMELHRKRIAVKTCMFVSSPMLIGFFRPVILLPEKKIPADELDYIFRHELTHYKRGDLWVSLLVLFVSAMHWFNPFVYLMAKAVRVDREAACDYAVISGNGKERRKHYAETIIGFIGRSASRQPVLSTYFYGGSYIMKKRLFAIMDTSRKNKILTALYTVGAFMAAVMSYNVAAALAAPAAVPAVGQIHVQPPPEPSAGQRGSEPRGSAITAEQARTIALNMVGGGTVARVETKYPKHGGIEFVVVIVSNDYRYNVHVNASDGNVRNYKADQITKVGRNVSNAAEAIGAERAKSIALQRAGGGIITDCNLDYKRKQDITVYHIHVADGQTEHCLELEASTGSIAKYESRYKP